MFQQPPHQEDIRSPRLVRILFDISLQSNCNKYKCSSNLRSFKGIQSASVSRVRKEMRIFELSDCGRWWSIIKLAGTRPLFRPLVRFDWILLTTTHRRNYFTHNASSIATRARGRFFIEYSKSAGDMNSVLLLKCSKGALTVLWIPKHAGRKSLPTKNALPYKSLPLGHKVGGPNTQHFNSWSTLDYERCRNVQGRSFLGECVWEERELAPEV